MKVNENNLIRKMGVVTNNEDIKADNYNVHRKAGRSIIDHHPVFSPDGE